MRREWWVRGGSVGLALATGLLLQVAACRAADTPKQNGSSMTKDSSAVATRAPASSRPTILFIGTSLTAGLGLDPDSAFPALIGRKADSAGVKVNVVNAGLSGETSAGALRRVDWLLTGPGDVIVLETGANDGLRGLDVDTTRANIDAILRKIQEAKPKATVFLAQMAAPPNMGQSYFVAFARIFPDLAARHKVTLIPFVLDGVAGKPELNQGDGIHPNERGERVVAANVWRVVGPLALLQAP